MNSSASNRLSDFHVSRRLIYLCILASFVGAFGAVLAFVLTKLIGLMTNLFFYHKLSFAASAPYPNALGVWAILVPAAGGLIIGLMARYGSEKIRGHGIPEAMEAILIGKSIVSPRLALLKPVSAAISIGSGGPFGAEGPIIMSGSSLGSVIGQMFLLTAAERKVLLLSGAAAGMSATFHAPIASVIFAIELLAFEMRPRSVIPIALASGISDLIRVSLIGGSVVFPSGFAPAFGFKTFLLSIGFGLLGAVLAFILTKSIYKTEDAFQLLPIHWMWWPALGGLVIGIGGYFVPRALGVGYDTIGQLVAGQFPAKMVLLLFFVKAVIWIVALGSGTSGGILAPLLILGGTLGDFLAVVLHSPEPAIWSMLGMSAVFAGVTRSPLTSVVFMLELTHDLPMLLPTLLTCAVASGLSALILPRSILTEKIARRGRHIARDYVVDPFEQIRVSQVMTTMLNTWPSSLSAGPIGKVNVTDTVSKALEQMIATHAKHVVVVNDDCIPVGLITLRSLVEARRKFVAEETIRERHIHLMHIFQRRKRGTALPSSRELPEPF